ncbi:MAG: hypothetical protein V3V19_11390 [Cocleimonas sp.]
MKIENVQLPKIVICSRCNTKFEVEFDPMLFLWISCPGCNRRYAPEENNTWNSCDKELIIVEWGEISWIDNSSDLITVTGQKLEKPKLGGGF